MELFTPQVNFQICTISNTPRTPEHCIAYAFMVQWDGAFPDRSINKDSPEDMRWICDRAMERAKTYGIDGVTYFRTLGLVKTIIPAIASTNAIISAAATNEALKILTFCGQTLNNWYAYSGDLEGGIYTNTYTHARKDDCAVCSVKTQQITVDPHSTLADLRRHLQESPDFQLTNPSIRTGSNDTLYIGNPAFAAMYGPNLGKPMHELLKSGEVLVITDPSMNAQVSHIKIQIHFR